MYSPFSKFSNKDTFAFFERQGLPLVVEARKRAFPTTQRAPDVTRALRKESTVPIIMLTTRGDESDKLVG